HAGRPAWSPRSRGIRSCAARSGATRSFALPARGLAAPALHGAQDAAQDIEFIPVELRPVEEPPQPFHQMSGPIAEIDFVQRLVEVIVEMLHIAGRRQREL